MKNRNRVLAVTLAGSMLAVSTLPVHAENKSEIAKQSVQKNISKEETSTKKPASYTKNENVYARLTADGMASDAYVVNHFSVKNSGEIIDYGQYNIVKNLTTLKKLSEKNHKVEFQADDGEFYYQGKIQNVELPWKFDIRYELDGESITAEELAGKSGKLKITFKSKKNMKANKCFYDNYLMQVSATLDCEKAKNITADGATIADAGADKQLSFTVLPGKDAKFVIKADVNDFTMSGFSIAAVPYSMDVDTDQFNTDDFTGQISELTDAVDKLNDGTSKLSEGLNKLCDNNGKLLNGSGQLQSGLNKLSSNSATISAASSQIKDALDMISTQLQKADFSDISKLSKVPDGLSKLAEALDGIQSGLNSLGTSYAKAYTALDQTMQSETSTLTEKEMGELQKCVQGNPDAGAAYQKLMNSYQQLLTIKGTYQKVKPAFEAVLTTLSSQNKKSVIKGIQTVSSNLKKMADSFSSLSKTDIDGQMNTLKNGLSKLASQYGKFNQGLSSYTDGVDLLSKNYGTFNNGVSSYLNGTAKIKGGATELAGGMGQFANGINDMPEQIQSTIDNMLEDYSGKNYHPVSFINKKIKAVQFVISTNNIEKAEKTKTKKSEKKEDFFDRFKALFQ